MSEMAHDLPTGGDVPEFDLADRLRKSLRTSGIGVYVMSEYLEVSRNTVGNWINGKTHPRPSELKLWALRTRVDYKWLLTGKLPRGDSNSQPAGSDAVPRPNGRALVERMAKQLSPETEALIRQAIPIRPTQLIQSAHSR
jgi:transcriptional regulator with XRE-family HTH domain